MSSVEQISWAETFIFIAMFIIGVLFVRAVAAPIWEALKARKEFFISPPGNEWSDRPDWTSFHIFPNGVRRHESSRRCFCRPYMIVHRGTDSADIQIQFVHKG